MMGKGGLGVVRVEVVMGLMMVVAKLIWAILLLMLVM